MAEEYDAPRTHECDSPVVREEVVEVKDRGVFDFMGKKHEEVKEGVIISEFPQKVNVHENEEKKHGLLEKLHRSDSSSSSSQSEEEEEEEKKKKKKKKKKDKREKEEMKEEERVEDTTVPIEKYEEEVVPALEAEEKKGFLEKIKEKIPVIGGHTKKAEEVAPPPPPSPSPSDDNNGEAEGKEKKGLLEKIKEKLPGYHTKSQEDEKESTCA